MGIGEKYFSKMEDKLLSWQKNLAEQSSKWT